MLAELGADLTIEDRYGDTAIALAICKGHDIIVDALLSEFGCDPSTKGHLGMSLLLVKEAVLV